jgi:hypothetical protein
MEDEQWLELLQPFTSVNHLALSREWVRRVAPALQELAGGRAPEVLPALKTLFFEGPQPSGPVKKVIREFIAARRLSGRTVVLSWS